VVCLGCKTSTHFIFMHGWVWCRSNKKHGMTRYHELMFLHLVGYAGHVVRSGASEAQNVNTLFFILRSVQCGSHKHHVEARYAKHMFLYPLGSVGHIVRSGAFERKMSTHYFSYSSGSGADPKKVH
jgi:hypothetical protein